MLLSDVVGVLLKAYPLMMPELMAYQASIIKCCCNFDRLAWAQNNRVYLTHLVQTKDLQWSRPPQLLFCRESEETCCMQILLKWQPLIGSMPRQFCQGLPMYLGSNLHPMLGVPNRS